MDQIDLSRSVIVGAIHIGGITYVQSSTSAGQTVTAGRTERQSEEVLNVNVVPSLAYRYEEYPSQRPHVCSTVSHSLGAFFVSFLPKDDRIRDILWAFETPFLRIWTVLDQPDFDFERYIYEAEIRFLDKIDEFACDFSIIYACGKSIADIRPAGAISVK